MWWQDPLVVPAARDSSAVAAYEKELKNYRPQPKLRVKYNTVVFGLPHFVLGV